MSLVSNDYLVSEQFLTTLPEPIWGPIGKEVYERTYSRVKANGQSETWYETVARVVEGNLALVDQKFIEAGERHELLNLIYSFKLLPAGRHLWVSGIPGRQFINNCFSHETRVLTRVGWQSIRSLVGEEVEVVTADGKWVKTVFKSYGKQELMKITYTDGNQSANLFTVFATPDHNWFVAGHNFNKWKSIKSEVKTKELKVGDRLPIVRPKTPYKLSPTGIAHGIVFGDGTWSHDGTSVSLFGNKKALSSYFKNIGEVKELPYKEETYIKISGLDHNWKSLPSIHEDIDYLAGFLAGWIATDGSLRSNGSLRLANKSKVILEFAKNVAAILGLRTSEPTLESEINPFTKEPRELWSVSFFKIDAPHGLLIRNDWEDTFVLQGDKSGFDTVRITEISYSDRFEEVFCCVIPETHALVIEGNVLTGQCWNSHWADKFSRHFCFSFERLMEGGGVGANYSNKYIKHFKPFKRSVDLHFVCSPEHKDYERLKPLLSKDYSSNWTGSHTISDNREGWVESLRILLDSYHDETSEDPVVLVFDVSIIRPAGARIKGFGGTASGPLALAEMLVAISKKLNGYKGQKPTSLLCMEIDHEIGKCVIAGNVRRSARMSMKHWLDTDIFDFITCKADGQGHWSTNISVVLDNNFFRRYKRKDAHAMAVMQAIANGMLHNGEPGIYNIDKASEGESGEAFTTNPCGEIAFSSPWEQCNLGHVNLAAYIDDLSGLYKAMRLMARFLIRATYADIPDDEARKVVDINRRIGVGFFGFHDWICLQGKKFSECWHDKDVRHILNKCHDVVRKEARDYAFELRIPEPIKTTTVAPTGTIAKLPGAGEGMHLVFSPFFKRRVRFSTVDPSQAEKLAFYKAAGYEVEKDVKSANTEIVSFYVKDALTEKLEKKGLPLDLLECSANVHLEDQLAVQAMIQECYADNAISFTANIIKDEYTVDDIMKALEVYGPRIKGMTLMPEFSNIPQMPMERITKEEWERFHLRDVGQAELDCVKGCPIK